MFNPSVLLRRLKRRMGIPIRNIPLSDNDMMDIIYEETLPVYSNYFPYIINKKINGYKNLVDNKPGFYRINLEEDLEILGISQVRRSVYSYTDRLNAPVRLGSFAERQMVADLTSITAIPITFRFYPPNVVEVFPKDFFKQDFMVSVKCIHPKHLSTIEPNMREEFFKLAEYDVRIVVNELLINLDNINTAFGNLELKLDKFSEAEDRRKELLELWDNNFIKQANRKKLYFV